MFPAAVTAVEFGCPAPGFDSCPDFPGFDDLDNYMSYFDDPCMETFTPLQIELMQMAWETFRDGGGESCECPISSGKGKGKSSKSGKGRGGRELRRNGNNNGKGKGKSKSTTVVNTQYVFPTNLPPCGGVDQPNSCVKWIEVEGTGSNITVAVEAVNVYSAISVFEDGCDLMCVDGFDSYSGDGSSGDSELTFASEKDVFYLVAISAYPLCDAVNVMIN